MKIYEIGIDGYWTGLISEILDGSSSPSGWTRTPVPKLKSNQFALWTGEWTITSQEPAELVSPVNNRIFRYDSRYVKIDDLPAIIEEYLLNRNKVN